MQSAAVELSEAVLLVSDAVLSPPAGRGNRPFSLADTALGGIDAHDHQRPAQCGGDGAGGVFLSAGFLPLPGWRTAFLRADFIPHRHLLFPLYGQRLRVPAYTKTRRKKR